MSILALAGLADPAQFGAIWLTWWLGDVAGAILFTPLLVLWYREPSLRGAGEPRARGGAAARDGRRVTSVVFFHPLLASYPLAFLCLPPLVWAAFRFRQRAVVDHRGRRCP